MPEPPIQQNASFDEERGEILASVIGALAGDAPDPDKRAACSYLLKHLLKAPAVYCCSIRSRRTDRVEAASA
jgi:hypothetical protein